MFYIIQNLQYNYRENNICLILGTECESIDIDIILYISAFLVYPLLLCNTTTVCKAISAFY